MADNGLNTTASVVGILTFVVAVSASCIALFSTGRSADLEIETFTQELDHADAQIAMMESHIRLERRDRNPEVTQGEEQVLKAYEDRMEFAVTALKLTMNARRSEISGLRNTRNAFLRRFKWVMKRAEISQKMARMTNQKGNMAGIQLSFLLE